MANHLRTAAGLAALAFLGVGSSFAVPQAKPVYTFCEEEDNDLCSSPDTIDASVAVASLGGDEDLRDCFYITGKLQEDCIWGNEPKCAIRVYDKPAQCRDSDGHVIPGAFYEPIIRSSNGADLTNVAVLSDRTVRIGVTAVQDALDGTINGLNNNGAHGECGEVTVKVTWSTGDDGQPRGGGENYIFNFENGSDAARFAVVVPAGVTSVTIQCCNNTGQDGVCYDVDHYLVQNLIPSVAYAIEVIGGKEDYCDRKTDTVVGWFDKNCNLIDFNDDKCPGTVYSHIFAFAEVDGTLRFAVSGSGDEDFDGLEDSKEADFEEFLLELEILEGFVVDFRTGASLKDASAGDVTRYPRELWDDYEFKDRFYGAPEGYFDHDVCGGYCIKISLAEHVDHGDRPAYPPLVIINGARSDFNADGFVNASDLALMLSFWGQGVQ
jgi:hypothetical protein